MATNPQQDPKKDQDPRKPLRNVAMLSGVALQMGVTIYLFVVFGRWLDTKYNYGDKMYIIIMTLLGVAISLYVVIKQVNKINN